MKKFLLTVIFIAVILSLVACVSPALPEQVDPAMWSISASPPPLTEDAFHLLHLRDDEDIYIHLGMTRENARIAFPNLGVEGSGIFPQWGSIRFDDDDRIDQIMIFVNTVTGNPYAMLWTTPSGIALGSHWSEINERFDSSYNRSSLDGAFRLYFTRNHIPVHPESEEWEYRSYYVSLTGRNDEGRIFSITIESRRE